ncbi:MAG: hypothetical protein U5L45_09655 [Saprospiraceae bacterium]|nr:hypothetical protein [Saprospiraceae bacterium]
MLVSLVQRERGGSFFGQARKMNHIPLFARAKRACKMSKYSSLSKKSKTHPQEQLPSRPTASK